MHCPTTAVFMISCPQCRYQQIFHFTSTGTAAASKAAEAFYTFPDINLWTPPATASVYFCRMLHPTACSPSYCPQSSDTDQTHSRQWVTNSPSLLSPLCTHFLFTALKFKQGIETSGDCRRIHLRTCYFISWYWFRDAPPAPALGKRDRLPTAAQDKPLTPSKCSPAMAVKHTVFCRCCAFMGKSYNPSCLEELVF